LRPPVPLLRGRELNDSDCGENIEKKSLTKDIIYNISIIEKFDNRNIWITYSGGKYFSGHP